VTGTAITNGQVIRTQGLTKRYGDLWAVDSVDLDVRTSDVYGFLGANGSGKTTTLRMLLGLVLPTSGEAEVLGMPMPAARQSVLPRVGSLVESPGAYPHLSGAANLAILDATGSDRSAPRPDQYGTRAGRTQRSRSPAGPDLLAGDGPAAWAGGCTRAQTAAVDLG
jgi:ABC-type multidrug transport system ATPase subunit